MLDSQIDTKDYIQRKKIGAFYTPPALTEVLCQWAVRSPIDRILEPSFGGCDFLEQAVTRLDVLGAKKPLDQMYGTDIDDNAFKHLSEKIGISDPNGHFAKTDFLSLSLESFSKNRVDAIIGNPPYISHHNMSDEQLKVARKALRAKELFLSKRASLWAYFVLHGLQFLKTGGRVAWVLPGSYLFSDYANEIKTQIRKKFKRSLTVLIHQRLFLSSGSDESTVILLAEGYEECGSAGRAAIESTSDIESLKTLLEQWERGDQSVRQYIGNVELAIMSDEGKEAFSLINENENSKPLNNFCDILIGIVTGANKFFILSHESALNLGLPTECLKPIFSKFHLCGGGQFTKKDIDCAINNKKSYLLIDTTRMRGNDAVRSYLETFPAEKIASVRTFKKRRVWHQPDDGRVPDAFFPYMQQNGPRLIINKLKLNCTNTIHRVFFKPKIAQWRQKLIAISLLSTFSQLSSEIVGRSYGSGVLKHEPSEAKKIQIYIPNDKTKDDVKRVFASIDTFLRNGDIDQARREADMFIFAGCEQFGDGFIDKLTVALNEARIRRQGKIKNV